MINYGLAAAGVCLLLALPGVGRSAAPAPTRVPVEGVEASATTAKVWVGGIPNENASLHLSKAQAHEGKQSLQLHYHFTGGGQYLGVQSPFPIDAPIHKVRLSLYGDGSGSGYGVYLLDASGETHKFRDAATMKIDFRGWKEIEIDLDRPHETWGGDKNGKLDAPLRELVFEISTPGKAVEGDLYFDNITVDSETSAAATLHSEIGVTSPAYGADVKGSTRVELTAPGFEKVTVSCWKQGPGFGTNTTIAEVTPNSAGHGSFVFPANDFPHGPLTVTLSGSKGTKRDNCYLQLYNRGGVSWNEGLPKSAPPAARDLKLVFADDFNGPLSISSTDPKARYYDHKPPNGSQDFSSIPFTGNSAPNTPFAQVDTYLRIRASETQKSAGIISSLKNDGSGLEISAPCYFECRFTAQSAIGTWPAFCLLTDNLKNTSAPCDELDVIEAYGGEGPTHPNAAGLYQVTPHAWNQGDAGKKLGDDAYRALHNPADMKKLGIPSSWHNTFHTYGVLVTERETVYYCDNIPVGRHETLPISKKAPLYFLINMATGGGWPVDLSRYNGQADMYVDWVRVYAGK